MFRHCLPGARNPDVQRYKLCLEPRATNRGRETRVAKDFISHRLLGVWNFSHLHAALWSISFEPIQFFVLQRPT